MCSMKTSSVIDEASLGVPLTGLWLSGFANNNLMAAGLLYLGWVLENTILEMGIAVAAAFLIVLGFRFFPPRKIYLSEEGLCVKWFFVTEVIPLDNLLVFRRRSDSSLVMFASADRSVRSFVTDLRAARNRERAHKIVGALKDISERYHGGL